jgi:hypothetical protein
LVTSDVVVPSQTFSATVDNSWKLTEQDDAQGMQQVEKSFPEIVLVSHVDVLQNKEVLPGSK